MLSILPWPIMSQPSALVGFEAFKSGIILHHVVPLYQDNRHAFILPGSFQGSVAGANTPSLPPPLKVNGS